MIARKENTNKHSNVCLELALLYGISVLIVIDCTIYGVSDYTHDISIDYGVVAPSWVNPTSKITFLIMKSFLILDFLIMLASFWKINKVLKQFP